MMIYANLLTHLWLEAIVATVYITNQLLTKTLKNKIQYKIWYDEQLNLSNLKAYNCYAYVVDYQAKSKGKMLSQSWAGTFVGYEAKN